MFRPTVPVPGDPAHQVACPREHSPTTQGHCASCRWTAAARPTTVCPCNDRLGLCRFRVYGTGISLGSLQLPTISDTPNKITNITNSEILLKIIPTANSQPLDSGVVIPFPPGSLFPPFPADPEPRKLRERQAGEQAATETGGEGEVEGKASAQHPAGGRRGVIWPRPPHPASRGAPVHAIRPPAGLSPCPPEHTTLLAEHPRTCLGCAAPVTCLPHSPLRQTLPIWRNLSCIGQQDQGISLPALSPPIWGSCCSDLFNPKD